MLKITIGLMLAGVAFGAPGFDAVPRGLAHGTVSQLPTASSWTNTLFLVTDGASASDCTTGSGSTRVLCVSNGSAWIGAGGSGSSGTLTNVATTSPITGGPITTTGTIACATCVTSAGSLTSTQIMTGAGSQGSQTPSSGATVDSSGNLKATSVCAGASCPAVTSGTGGVVAGPEGTVPTVCAASAVDCIYFDSTRHGPLLSVNNGSYLSIPTTPASTTSGNVPTYSDAVGNLGAGITPGTGVATALAIAANATGGFCTNGGGGCSGGGSPGGSGTEIQYRAGASTFGAVTGSSVSGANVTIPGNMTFGANGRAIIDQSGSGGGGWQFLDAVSGSFYGQGATNGIDATTFFMNGTGGVNVGSAFWPNFGIQDIPTNTGFTPYACSAAVVDRGLTGTVRDSNGDVKQECMSTDGGTTFVWKTLGDSNVCFSNAAPAVCNTAHSGAVAIPTGVNSTLTVNTSSVTARSIITLTPDSSLAVPSTTCNTTAASLAVQPYVSARTPGTSFTISFLGTITTNPVCVGYAIANLN
jgi:hypothetical protein